MKIFKSSLQELLNEGIAPFYICNFRERRGGDIPLQISKLSVAAFNKEGRVCELMLATVTTPAFLVEELKKDAACCDAWEKEVRTRLKALDLEIRDGRLSDTEVVGGLDG